MQQPSTQKILFYQVCSLGIYFFVWCYRLGKELGTALQRKAVPSMWWFIVPGGNLYWMWRMSESLEAATGKRLKQIETFLLYLLLSGAGLGGATYFPDFSNIPSPSTNTTPEHINVALIVTIVLIVIAVVFLIAIVLHGVFMAIMQSRLNKIRGVS